MYNTNYKCVKPFDVWLDAIGPDGKKIPYRVKRGTIWRLEWCGDEQSFKEFTGPDNYHSANTGSCTAYRKAAQSNGNAP